MKFVLFIALFAACGGEDPKPETPPPPPKVEMPGVDARVQKALDVAHAVDADPAKANEVLAAKGMTADDLDTLLYEIAADGDLSAQYEKGRRVQDGVAPGGPPPGGPPPGGAPPGGPPPAQ